MNTIDQSQAHERVFEILPWWLNQSLDDIERADADAHIAQCEPCQAEIHFLRSMQQTVQRADDNHAAGNLPTQLREAVRNGRRQPRMRWTALAAGLVIAASTFAVAMVIIPSPGEYHTVTDARDVASPLLVRVTFDDNTNVAGIRELIREARADIVGGDLESGELLLRIPDTRALTLLVESRHVQDVDLQDSTAAE